MLPTYRAELLDFSGKTTLALADLVSVTAARAFNTEGNATLVIPDDYELSRFQMHTRMKLWRSDYRGVPYNFGETVWFLKKIDHDRAAHTLTLNFVDTIGILKGRLVAYTGDGPYADKTLDEFDVADYTDDFHLDNMMRQYMRENYGADALDARRIVAAVTIEGDRFLAPYGEKQASFQEMLSVLTDLANQSASKGTPLYFDLVAQTDGTFVFRVQATLPGKDRRRGTGSALVLSEDSNMITDVHEITDFTNVATYCYALGQGSGGSQLIAEAEDDRLARGDPFSRIEMTVSGSDISEPTVLADTAAAALRGRRQRRIVTAKVVENSALAYGRDINYGDGVVIQVAGREYDVLINAISTRWQDGREQLDMRLEGETFL